MGRQESGLHLRLRSIQANRALHEGPPSPLPPVPPPRPRQPAVAEQQPQLKDMEELEPLVLLGRGEGPPSTI